MCVICGGGDSDDPNRIVFCERCMLAVHQTCYCVPKVPDDDWLCWPCTLLEDQEKQQGLPPSRPERWKRVNGDSDALDPRVPCALCPVVRGALKRSAAPDDDRWAHVACALWCPEASVRNIDDPEAIDGIQQALDAQAKRSHKCAVCNQKRGVPVPCSFGHCGQAFHPLCARRAGMYLSSAGGKHRLFCMRHSNQARDRDQERQRAAPPPPPKPTLPELTVVLPKKGSTRKLLCTLEQARA